MSKRDYQLFDQTLNYTRMYFQYEYKAGTREMVYRYVCTKAGDVPPLYISAALKIMKKNTEIIFDKRVWWKLR